MSPDILDLIATARNPLNLIARRANAVNLFALLSYRTGNIGGWKVSTVYMTRVGWVTCSDIADEIVTETRSEAALVHLLAIWAIQDRLEVSS